MQPQLSVAYERFQQLVSDTLLLLPGLGIAIVVFVLFLGFARAPGGWCSASTPGATSTTWCWCLAAFPSGA